MMNLKLIIIIINYKKKKKILLFIIFSFKNNGVHVQQRQAHI